MITCLSGSGTTRDVFAEAARGLDNGSPNTRTLGNVAELLRRFSERMLSRAEMAAIDGALRSERDHRVWNITAFTKMFRALANGSSAPRETRVTLAFFCRRVANSL